MHQGFGLSVQLAASRKTDANQCLELRIASRASQKLLQCTLLWKKRESLQFSSCQLATCLMSRQSILSLKALSNNSERCPCGGFNEFLLGLSFHSSWSGRHIGQASPDTPRPESKSTTPTTMLPFLCLQSCRTCPMLLQLPHNCAVECQQAH